MDKPLPPAILARCDQLATACKAVNREIRKLQNECGEAGITFPHSAHIILSHMDMDLDALYIILQSHVKVDAENLTGR